MSERMLDAGIDWDFETFDEYLKLVEHAARCSTSAATSATARCVCS